MRKFQEIQDELKLKKFLDSPMGTLYFVPSAPDRPRVIVRHFDSQIPVSLVESFASLTQSASVWTVDHPPLDRLVRVVLPNEIGQDFITREHFTYYTSTESYELDEDDQPPEPPDELEVMRDAFRNACTAISGSADAIIETVLSRSLLEPTGKTFFDENVRSFIVVELKPTRNELDSWKILMGEGKK